MLNFYFLTIFYKNMVCLMTSTDLTRFYCVGFLLSIFFFSQIFSGILLSFMYSNNFCWFSCLALADFESGYLIRSFHMTGTSVIFFCLYAHLFKIFFTAILHNSSFFVFLCGCALYLLTVIMAFLGYVLPLTQMSYWGLTVFSNILSTLPFGSLLCFWLWGSEFIQDYTLIKVHAIHVFLPFMLMFIMVAHLFFLHCYLSSEGFFDRLSFYMEKNVFFLFFLYSDLGTLLGATLMFYYGIVMWWFFVFHEESFSMASSTKTSDKMIPEWFFLTFFGFIKAVPDKLGGVCILVFFMINFGFLVFFMLLFFYYLNWAALYMEQTIFLISLLYMIGILSTNVTLLFPALLELQFLVILIMYHIFMKIL